MKNFQAVDYLAVFVYLAMIAALGSSFYRRRSTAREYFLGSRSIWWLPAGISIVAADLSAITIMGTPAWAYGHNLELLWTSLGYLLAAPIIIFVFVPFYSRLDLYTAYEYLEKRFDVRVRTAASALFLMLRGMHVALVIYAPSLVIRFLTGIPEWQAIAFIGLFTTFYTTLGGIKAVIWTDVIQFCTVMTGVLLVFSAAMARIPGGMPAAIDLAAQAGKLHWLNTSTNPAELTSIWAIVFGGLVLCMAPLATDQAVLQRLFTTKSEQDCRRSVLVQSVVIMPLTLVLFLTGTVLWAFYQHFPARLEGLPNADAIVPFFVVRELPAGVSGVIVAAIFAASMAVMSAGINSLTTATTVDFYQRLFRPAESPEHYAQVGRAGTIAWGALATVVALYANRLGELALAYNKISSIISGPLLGVFLLATMTRRATGSGALAGAAAGMIAVLSASAFTDWSFFWHGPVGLIATFVAGYAVSGIAPARIRPDLRGLVVWDR